MTKVLNVLTASQVIVAQLVISNIAGGDGWWGSKGEEWAGVIVKTTSDPAKVGNNFAPAKAVFDLCETGFVDALFPHAVKFLGADYTRPMFRKDLWAIMWGMRSDTSNPVKAGSNIGIRAGSGIKGRPSADDLVALTKPKKARKAKSPKPAANDDAPAATPEAVAA